MRSSLTYLLQHFSKLLVCLLLFITEAKAGDVNSKADIERLKKSARQLDVKERVDALLHIGHLYIKSEFYTADSGLVYAEEAFRLAKRIDFKEGLTKATYLCGNISLQLSKVNKGLYYYRLLQQQTAASGNKHLEALAFRGIAQAQWYQGKCGAAIDTLKLAMGFFEKLTNRIAIADATMILSSIYSDMGNYEMALEEAQKALRLSNISGDGMNIVLSYVQLGYLYKNIGDYSSAMDNFKKGFSYKPGEGEWAYRHLCNRMGDLYTDLKKYDSAFFFYSKSLASHAESKTSLLRMGDFYLATQKYDKAGDYYNRVYQALKDGGEGNLVVFALLGLGNTSLAQKDPAKALRYGYMAMDYAWQRDSRLTRRDAFHLLSKVYEKLGRADSAFYYYKKFMIEKEAVVTDQFKGRLYTYKHASHIRMLENEKKINQHLLANNRLTKNIMAVGFVLLLVLGLIIFRNISLKRKNEKLQYERVQSEWKHRAGDLEMQALRAQMNPHFIFNALSSVNRFILKNDPEKASDYLTRFSRLIRLVLINSQKDMILLEEELEMLRLYLEMEQLRFKDAFDYHISYSDEVDPSSFYVPPLLLQPFCENAIWHGLMHKDEKGELLINFSMEDGMILCLITDNGIGTKRAAELASKSAEKFKSLGLKLTRDRLALFNMDHPLQPSYEINDLTDEAGNVTGTQVRLHIRHQSFVNAKTFVSA